MQVLPDTPKSRTEITGYHVLAAMLGFFGLVFAVNGYFIAAALSTHTGVVANEPYRKGLKYNERIAVAERQAQLGWHDEVKLDDGGRKLSILVRDSGGQPVRGLALSATLGRPATNEFDQHVSLSEDSPGRYVGEANTRERGGYVASVEARDPAHGDAIVYQARRRIWLSP